MSFKYTCSDCGVASVTGDDWVTARRGNDYWHLCSACSFLLTSLAPSLDPSGIQPGTTPEISVGGLSFSQRISPIFDFETLFSRHLSGVFGEKAGEFSPALREALMGLWEKGLGTASHTVTRRGEALCSSCSGTGGPFLSLCPSCEGKGALR